MDIEIKNEYLLKAKRKVDILNICDCYVMHTKNIILKPKNIQRNWIGNVSEYKHLKIYEELSSIKLNS